jgi:hypothetical protein
MRWFYLSVGFIFLTLATTATRADTDTGVPGRSSSGDPSCEALKAVQNSYDMDTGGGGGGRGGGGFACPFCRMASGFLGNLMGMYRGAYGNASKKSGDSAKKSSDPVTSILGFPGLTPSAKGNLSPSLARSALY